MPSRTLPPIAMMLLFAASVHAESPDALLANYRTPAGWRVEIAATEPLVVNPVAMTWGPDNRLYVVEWKEGRDPNDHIKVLTDVDGDGKFDKADLWMEGFDLPAGLCFWDDWTYITLDHDVVRFHDPDHDGKYDRRESIVTGFGNDNSHHRVSGITIGPDGWLYMTTGDSDCHAKGSDGSEAHILRSGGVLRCHPDGSKIEVVAFGMRNPWGNVAFDDQLRMFHTDNDNEGAPGFTGCRLLHVVDGGDYGWRLREGARCCQPDYQRATWNGGRPGRLGWIAETGRGAPAGLCVLNSAAFPSQFRNMLIYPDVFRKLVRAYTLKPKGASFTVDQEIELLASDEGSFRPDDAEVGPDGALYILDWRTDSGGAGALSGNGQTGRIYRMTWTGTPDVFAKPTLARDRLLNLDKLKSSELAKMLDDEDYGLQVAVQKELIRRGRESGFRVETFFREASKGFDTPGRLLAFDALPILGERSGRREFVEYGLIGAKTPLERLGFDWIARSGETGDQSLAAMTLVFDTSRSSEILRSKLVALGSFGKLRRARPGEAIDFVSAEAKFRSEGLTARSLPPEEARAGMDRVMSQWRASLNADLVASAILQSLTPEMLDDPFLVSGAAIGLERLGPAGLDALQKEIAQDDAARSIRALTLLQAWRGTEGLEAVLNVATRKEDLPEGVRAALFRTLREMVPNVPPERVASWLEGSPNLEPDACVEAIRVLDALHEQAIPAAGPILPRLLADPSEKVRLAALALARSVRTEDAEKALIAIAKDKSAGNDERRRTISALRGYENESFVPLLDELVGSNDDPGFQGELLRTLASLDFGDALRKSQSLLDSKSPELRREGIAVLGQKPEGALKLVNLYNDGKLPAEDLPTVIEAVRSHSTPELQAATQIMLKNKLLAAPTGDEAARLREFVAQRGNAERGREIYLDAKKGNCASCHRLEGSGGNVGPDLTRLWDTLSFDKRVESILDPSKEIKEGFNTFRVATKDGKILSGLLLSDVPEGVTLKDAQGQEVRIPVSEIDEKGNDPSSLMPAGVVGHLSFEELADLLFFLGDRGAQESLRGRE